MGVLWVSEVDAIQMHPRRIKPSSGSLTNVVEFDQLTNNNIGDSMATLPMSSTIGASPTAQVVGLIDVVVDDRVTSSVAGEQTRWMPRPPKKEWMRHFLGEVYRNPILPLCCKKKMKKLLPLDGLPRSKNNFVLHQGQDL